MECPTCSPRDCLYLPPLRSPSNEHHNGLVVVPCEQDRSRELCLPMAGHEYAESALWWGRERHHVLGAANRPLSKTNSAALSDSLEGFDQTSDKGELNPVPGLTSF